MLLQAEIDFYLSYEEAHGDGDDDAAAIMCVNDLCDVSVNLKDGSKVHMVMDMARRENKEVNLDNLDRIQKAIVEPMELLDCLHPCRDSVSSTWFCDSV